MSEVQINALRELNLSNVDLLKDSKNSEEEKPPDKLSPVNQLSSLSTVWKEAWG